MKTTSQEYQTLKNLLSLTEKEFRHFHRIWEKSKILDVDSRMIDSRGLFLAQKGLVTDGHLFIPEVLSRGANVIVDPSYPGQSSSLEKKIIRIPDLSSIVGKLGAIFYHYPSKRLRIVGITGTDGKTTTTRLLAEAYHSWGYYSAGIGTLGVYVVGNPKIKIPHYDTPNTTPHPIILQRILYSLYRVGIKIVVMEISSHGLTLERVQEVALDSGIWINLSPEHLDYHGNLENYARTKSRLFELLRHSPKKIKHGVMGLDSFIDIKNQQTLPWIREIMVRVEAQAENYSMSFFCYKKKKNPGKKFADILPSNLKSQVALYSHFPHKSSQVVEVKTGENLGKRTSIIPTGLIGQFNAQNIAAACLELEHFRREISPRPHWNSVKKVLKEVKVKGRLEEYSLEKNCHSGHPRYKILKQCRLYIDYAHTPQALEKILIALRDTWGTPILCVFGCGGDRDHVKRKPMGAVACRLANIVLITDDNPRIEPPEIIRQTIVTGWQEQYCQLSKKKKVSRKMEIVPGRREAIRRALEIIPQKGIILLAGKGHEDYQIIGRKKLPFDEREVLREILSNSKVL